MNFSKEITIGKNIYIYIHTYFTHLEGEIQNSSFFVKNVEASILLQFLYWQNICHLI